MKILVLSDDFPPQSFGGAGMVAFNLSREMQKRGHEVRVVTTVRTAAEAKDASYGNLKIHRVVSDYSLYFRAYRGLWNPGPARFVQKILEEFKPDIVHAHNIHTHLSYHSLTLAKRAHARVMLTCHDVFSFHFGKFTEFIDEKNVGLPATVTYRISPWRQLRAYRLRYNPFRNICIRHILRKSVDHVVAVSEALKQAMEQNRIKNVEMIHNGIDAASWQIDTDTVASFKKEFGLENKKVVLFSGRLEGAKGGWHIMRAFEKISAQMPAACLLILAQKDASAEAKLAYAHTKGFAKQVVFAGWQEGPKLHAAYAAAHVIVNPSVCLDTFGLVNIEAMALHKPVVATCFGGSPEIVLDGKTGYVVNPFNISILAKKIEDLLINEEKAKRFGETGYHRVIAKFSLQKQAEEYDRLYRI